MQILVNCINYLNETKLKLKLKLKMWISDQYSISVKFILAPKFWLKLHHYESDCRLKLGKIQSNPN